jgi:formate hydrogenlyase subunit 4
MRYVAMSRIRPIKLITLAGLAIMVAIIVPALYAKANGSGDISIVVTRVDSWQTGSYVTLSNTTITSYPTILLAMQQADTRYDTLVALCNAHPSCMQSSILVYHTPNYVTNIADTEAKSDLANLQFHDIPISANESPVIHHGLHIEYNGKFYAISIEGI